ncbi:MAG: FAD-dependent oxidoreductase, partial [Anaerolineae bacterium]|nr:FAD-dependent oxidoreductase [Anaerolineae bacterium]
METNFPTPIENGKPVGAVMVVGGGIAGMQASLDMANAGFKVYLVEKKPAIGGHMAALDKTFPTNDCAMCTISPRLVDTASHHNIEVLTDSELLSLSGQAGSFKAAIRRNPRYIDLQKCTACGDCAAVCPVTLPDEFNFELNQRKAAYKLYPQAVPNAFAIAKKGISPCRDACPAGQRAQGYIAMIREGRYEEALRVIKEDNPFPGICGRICNHRCETACTRNLVDEPIAIASLKRFAADYVYSQPYQPPKPAQRKFDQRIAVIGAGPCGLTAAKDLVMAGYGVTVFEALPLAGGMLRVGVPEYRLPARIVQREVQEIVDLGVELRLNTKVENLNDITEQGFQAVLIAVGAHRGKRLPIENANHPEVITAVDFLRDVRMGTPPDLRNQHILVLGGGNVAVDCARTAMRMGASKVDMACLESRSTMPADESEIIQGAQEGIDYYPSRSFTRILGTNGNITGVEAVRVSKMHFEEDGSLFLETVPNSEHQLACDKVIFAIGQRAGLAFIPEESDIGVTRQGTVAINNNTLATSREGVFAAGDAIRGTTFVIEAVATGHQAAQNIIKYLQGENLETRNIPEKPVAAFSATEIAEKIQREEIRVERRVPMAEINSHDRIQTFNEVHLGYTEEEARKEASRCLQCGICSECLSCVYKCAAGAIDHEQAAQIEELDVGAVILASGFEAYNPIGKGEYGFGRYPNVVTSMQYERILSPSGPYSGHLKRPLDGEEPKRIAWIQCVGSRQADRDWCSAVCCMYATKQTIITKEHAPETECTVFYIDFRAYGKGFDAYYEQAKEMGVRYIRSMPSGIKQNTQTGNLEIEYALPDGDLVKEEFDLVVLSVGMQPPASMSKLAEEIAVESTQDGFCMTTNLSPLDTSREGVYVCGPLADPKDIPETVMSASGAAARAMTLLARARYDLVTAKEYPPEIDIGGQDPRIGVFVCHCGSNIAGVVDVAAVAEYAKSLPNVVMADHTLFTCSTDSQANIRAAIQEYQLNRVVVASCTPRTHERLFQNTIREAGLNFYLFEMANIRDQCSWVHRDQPAAATEKAKDLLRMAVSKVRLVEPLQRKELEFDHDALVIGGGLAGISAALSLADQGFVVSVVERDAELGGNMRHLRLLQSQNDPQVLLQAKIQKLLEHPNVHVFMNAEVEKFDGSLGKYESTLKINSQEQQPLIKHGITILATGAQPYRPTEYLYGQDEAVITQLEFEEMLAGSPEDIKKLNSIVMIQCVGSRTPERPYCSRLCCNQAIKNALAVKRINPAAQVYVLYRDIRSYGLLEKYYREARLAGVIFLRFEDHAPPSVSRDGSLQVSLHDAMLDETIHLQADKVVLSVATVPRDDAPKVAQLLKVPLGQDGFFQEAHMKLAPVDFATEGIFLCGMSHYPKKALTESVIQASAAAARAAAVLAKRVIEIEPTISHVVEDKCDGCAYCVDPCPYNAITLVEYEDSSGQIKKRVMVDET